MSPKIDQKLIFDVGAHKGEDSQFYLDLGYSVVAVEANPFLVKYLKKRFSKQIKSGKFILVEKAISEIDGEIDFYINKQISVWGTVDKKWVQRNTQLGTDSYPIKVNSISFPKLLKQYGCPFYIKIDIEGKDLYCLKSLLSTKYRPKYLSFESTKTSWKDLCNELNLLSQLGYKKFQVVNQRKHQGGYFKTITGKYIHRTFPFGSSGRFGPQFEQSWLTKQLALLRYIPIFAIYTLFGDNTIGSKLLKKMNKTGIRIGALDYFDTHAQQGEENN